MTSHSPYRVNKVVRVYSDNTVNKVMLVMKVLVVLPAQLVPVDQRALMDLPVHEEPREMLDLL